MSRYPLNAIPTRTPWLLEERRPRTPQAVRVAPTPSARRSMPRLAASADGASFTEHVMRSWNELALELGLGENSFTIAIELGSHRGSDGEAEAELTEAGAR